MLRLRIAPTQPAAPGHVAPSSPSQKRRSSSDARRLPHPGFALRQHGGAPLAFQFSKYRRLGDNAVSPGAYRDITAMTKSQFCLGLTCLSVGVWACGGESELLEIESQQAALTATENSERALQGVIDAADFVAASTTIADTLAAFGGRSQTCDGAAACSGDDCIVEETVCTDDEASAEELEKRRQEMRANAEELVELLRDRILIEANLEAETSTSATYRIGADVLCEDDAPDGPSGASDDALDPDCVEEVERLEPRVVLTSPSEGDIDLTLQLGAAHHEPLTLALYHDSLGVRLDLGEALAVARELGQDEDVENVDALAGVLELRLVEHAARDYSLEVNVLEAIEAQIDSEGQSLSLSLGASSPAWDVRINGNSQTLSAGIDLGALRIGGPLRAFASLFESDDDVIISGDPFAPAQDEEDRPPRAYRGALELFLAGLNGTVSYTADTDVLAFDDLGYGDATSTIEHDGNTLFSLDLNENAGRHVNLRISPAAGGGAQVSITPSFDLKMAFAFQHIADQFEELSETLLDNTVRVWFDGNAPTLHVSDDRVQVTSGTLHVESTANPEANVTVEAGMCLGGSAEGEADESELEGPPALSLEAVACE